MNSIHRKVLREPLLVTSHTETDLATLRRLFVAACISPDFCQALLKDPACAVQTGFGGEIFVISGPTLEILSAIHAKTLSELILSVNEKIPIIPT